MAKRILRCSSKTTSETLLGGLGWWSLHARRNYKKLLYWFHLLSLDNSRLIKRVYLVTKEKRVAGSWTSFINKLLVKYGVEFLWGNEHLVYNLDGRGNLEAKSIEDHRRFWKSW